eukprot:CAMPEP_0203761368 /NCGR_PEP_ID=MMETSP0098-20131031/14471_1 /ASSEMBLY_ACC=CAM_ASM_000208 /TAXON_ID=96639 /ORGANISM=" , Strain NY0313808BC1" /LENGTH=233 /DNA_ID=CAMNT_0050655335 /DNA_START=199 /DNA_END=897 /DNA_ORIENTATION=+
MAKEKRKRSRFVASDWLQAQILELAGVQVSRELKNVPKPELPTNNEDENDDSLETSEDSASLGKEAKRLKHLADKTDGPIKFLLYLRSCLRYLEYSGSINLDQRIDTLGSTAALLEYAARKSHGFAKQALDTQNEKKMSEYGHLAYLGYKLAAVTRMNRFYLKSEKLRRFWDAVTAFDTKKQKAERLKRGNIDINAASSSQFYISPQETQTDARNREYIVKEAQDSIMAMASW